MKAFMEITKQNLEDLRFNETIPNAVRPMNNGNYLARVSMLSKDRDRIIEAYAERELTDDEAEAIIPLDRLDVIDMEIDAIVTQLGLDPLELRTRNGKKHKPLKEQEAQAIEVIVEEKKIDISQHLHRFRERRNDDHNNLLDKLRKSPQHP